MLRFYSNQSPLHYFLLAFTELVRAKTDPAARLKSVNAETKVILEQLEKDYKAPEEKVSVKAKADSINAVRSY